MALTISLTPGKTWNAGEPITIEGLNQTGNPTIELEGAISTESVADNSITAAKLQDGVLSADATGRAKMADEFLTAAKLGSDVAGDGLSGGAGQPLAVNVDDSTLEVDTSTPPELRIKANGAAALASSRNLLAFNNAAAPNNKADITADELLLKNSDGVPYLALTVSVTADLTASGANGLDTGTEASSTWYYLWVIYNGTAKAALLSTSSTAPTLPSGYTFKALVGAVRNNASSNFDTFYQQDRNVFLNDTNLFTDKGAAAINTYESYQAGSGSDVDLRTLIPPIAKRLRGTLGNSSNAANHHITLAADANGLAAWLHVAAFANNTVNGFGSAGSFEIPLKTAQTFYWKAVSTSARGQVNISGYSI